MPRFVPKLAFLLLASLFLAACAGDEGPAGRTPQPGELKTALESVRDEQLAIMALPKEEMGERFATLEISLDSGFKADEDAEEDTIDPDDTVENLRQAGWEKGYRLIFFEEGSVAVKTEVNLFTDAGSASGYLAKEVSDYQRLEGEEIGDWWRFTLEDVESFTIKDIGEEAVGVVARAGSPEEETKVYETFVYFRIDRLLALAAIIRLDDGNMRSTVTDIARSLERRIAGVLVGDVTGTPVFDTPKEYLRPTPQATEGLKGHSIQALVASGNTLYAGASGKGVFRSVDGGRSWAHAGLAHYPSNLIRALAVLGDTVYASASGEGVFASSDGGGSWIKTKNSPRFAESLVVSGDTLYGGGSRLKAGSDAWTPLFPLPELDAFFVVVGNTIYASTGKAGELPRIVRSQDGGDSWQPADKGLSEFTFITSLAASENTLYAAAATAGSRVFRSEDGGRSWTAAGAGLPGYEIRSMAALGGILYVAMGAPYAPAQPAGSKDGSLFRSADGGRTWSEANQGLTNLAVYSFASLGTTTYVGTGDGIFRSEDGGASWHR